MKLKLISLVIAVFALAVSANAATTVNIPFPPKIERPVWVPAYVNRHDSWPVSLVFAPIVIVMSVIGTAVEEPFGSNHTANLRKTAGVMTIDAVRGYRKFKEKRAERVAERCTVRGNWVGAPCN